MTQTQLDRAVAEVTGETLCTVRNRGFGIADPPEVNFDPEPHDRAPLVVDWDELDIERYAVFA